MNNKKQPTKKEKIEMDKKIVNSEGKEQVLKTWQQHMMNRDEVASFTTIVGDKMYNVTSKETETLLPFSEYDGDHIENWIILIENETKREILRKNTRTTDMIEWKLSSSVINKKNDGKQN